MKAGTILGALVSVSSQMALFLLGLSLIARGLFFFWKRTSGDEEATEGEARNSSRRGEHFWSSTRQDR